MNAGAYHTTLTIDFVTGNVVREDALVFEHMESAKIPTCL